MGGFPKFTTIPQNYIETITSHTVNKNVETSKLVPWIRIASAVNGGLVIESADSRNTFKTEYGGHRQSGKIGRTFGGQPVYAHNDRSYRPSPTITGITVENGTNGLSRKATFTINCYTKAQATELAKYFYEPGNTVFVEYGWNTKKSMGQRANLGSNAVCEIISYTSYEHVRRKREASGGMYDGWMGYITGGGFTNADDGGYVLNVELTTTGELAAYLQVHKGSVSKEKGKDKSLLFTDIDAKDEDHLGEALFKQMFNRLPKSKQTKAVKSLITKRDTRGELWSNQGNFINMDDENREELAGLTGSDVHTGDGTITIPDGMNIFSDKSYIRLELAFKILNTYHYNIDSTERGNCGDTTTSMSVMGIDYKNTIIKAHKYMFSLNDNLFIPNKNHPTFDIMPALLGKEVMDDGGVDFSSVTPVNGVITLSSDMVHDRIQMVCDNPDEYAFPQLWDYDEENSGGSDIEPTTAKAFSYGYLKDLYLNFEYFCEILDTKNFVAKDIYLEILNTISMSVNSLWEFEIMGEGKMEIRDLNFIGNVNPGIKNKIHTFDTTGKNSPFLTSSLDMNISASMRNMIIGTRMNGRTSVVEGPTVDGETIKTFWGGGVDPVLSKLTEIMKQPADESGGAEDNNTAPEQTQEEILKTNLQNFLRKGTVVGKTMKRGIDVNDDLFHFSLNSRTNVDDIFITVSWNDPELLKLFELGTPPDGINDPILLGVEFNFEVLGMSGFQVGTVFQLRDLPANYSNRVFQIMSTTNTISDDVWKTSVKSQLRNIKWK